jgi:hypothetical protein
MIRYLLITDLAARLLRPGRLHGFNGLIFRFVNPALLVNTTAFFVDRLIRFAVALSPSILMPAVMYDVCVTRRCGRR